MTFTLLRWLQISSAAATLPLLMTSSCGRSPIVTEDEPTGSVQVSGAFSDWTPGASSFADGLFLLLDPTTNEVFKSDIIDKNAPAFKIENVPVAGKYYGILVDAKFEAKAFLEKTASDGKKQRVFKLGATSGKLGTIVVRDTVLDSSEQSDLDFQTTYGANSEAGAWSAKKFTGKYSTTFSANPDIDVDGIPNVIDTDVDGDKLENIFDRFTYDGKDVADSAIAAPFNYGYGLPKNGFFKCDHLRTPTATDNSAFKLVYSCILKIPGGSADEITLLTNKTFKEQATQWNDGNAFDWKLRDDGTGGDLIAGDGQWSGRFAISESITNYSNQLILATVKLKDGQVKSFVTSLEPSSLLTAKDKDQAANPIVTSSQDANTKQTTLALVFQLANLTEAPDGVLLAATFFKEGDAAETPVYTTPSEKLDSATGKSLTDIGRFLPKEAQKYRLKIKLSAPPALPGLLGSAFELYSEAFDYTPP